MLSGRSVTVQRQMMAVSGLRMVVVVGLVLLVNLRLGGVQAEGEELTERVTPAALTLVDLDRDGYQAQLALERLASAPTDAAAADARAAWQDNADQTVARFAEFDELAVGLPGEADTVDRVSGLRERWLSAGSALVAAPPADRPAFLPAAREAFDAYRQQVDTLSGTYAAQGTRMAEQVQGTQGSIMTWNWIMLAVALIVGGSLTVTLARRMTAQVTERALRLRSASTDIDELARRMTSSASTTSDQAQAVTDAAGSVARSIETVTASVEELSLSIQEIAGNASSATVVAADAVSTAEESSRIISQLGTSSQQIDDVVKVINSIAEQTNLLALNATIEAARAGEAGRGFTVVANEVKELAAETARATGQIAARVTAIQGDTASAIEANERINGIIGRIAELQHSIATAVEEQSVVTSEIARSVTDAAQGSSQISSNVGAVAEQAASTLAAGTQAGQAAAELTELAAELTALVGAGGTGRRAGEG
jgi:archaellum component FlaC